MKLFLAVICLELILFVFGGKISQMKPVPILNHLNNAPTILNTDKSTSQSSNSQKVQVQSKSQVQVPQTTTIQPTTTTTTYKPTLVKVLVSSWGVLGVVMMFVNALQRLIPVALQPILQKDLTTEQGVIYTLFVLYMMYVEGYKAFHLKFSPMVVRRALHLSEHPTVLSCLLAGPYCMGLFGATRKRMIIGWGMMIGVFGLVKIVKFLPYPWRSIVDGGAAVGLTLGTLSTIYYYLLALLGYIPSINPELPPLESLESSSSSNKQE